MGYKPVLAWEREARSYLKTVEHIRRISTKAAQWRTYSQNNSQNNPKIINHNPQTIPNSPKTITKQSHNNPKQSRISDHI